MVWPIPALIGAALPSLAPKTAKQVGPLLRESLATDCKNFCGKVFAEWTEKRTPGGRPYHVMKTKERSMPLAIGPDGRPLTRVVGTPSALMPLVKKWTVGNPVTKQPGFHQTSKGRWRKVTEQGVAGSANCVQELAARAVVQNPALRRTPELVEGLMAIPAGWTDIGGPATTLHLKSRRSRGVMTTRACALSNSKETTMNENLCDARKPGPHPAGNSSRTEALRTSAPGTTKKARRKKGGHFTTRPAKENSEIISP